MGETSAHWLLAIVAVETGISPRELMELPPRLLWTMIRYMEAKNQKANNGRKGRR